MQPLIIGHRGAPCYEQENTLASFQKAIALGADMVELDVRRTRDKVLIVHHDPDVYQRPIRKLTYADLQAIAPYVPTLEAVIESCGGVRLDVELKEMGYERDVLNVLLQAIPPKNFVVTSFHPPVLRRIKRRCAEVRTGFLFSTVTADVCRSFRLNAKAVRDRIHNMQADFIAPDWRLLNDELLSKVVTGEYPIWVWTVNESHEIERLMKDRRIEGIITDIPDVGKTLREQRYCAVR